MKIIELSQIEVRNRQRSNIETEHLNDLKDSIESPKGLLHPPVVWLDAATNKYVLACGERRLRAIEKLAKENKTFRCGADMVLPGFVPVLEVTELNPVDYFEAELEENVLRRDLSWQDRARALDALHRMRKSENPEQTKSDTAKELMEKMGQDPLTPTGRVKPNAIHRELTTALIVAGRLDDPKIAKARNAAEAHALVLRQEEEKLHAHLAKRRIAEGGTSDSIKLRRGDLISILPVLQEGSFDLILADPPYGIDAGSAGFRGRTVHHHNYSDDWDTAAKVAQSILGEGFRVLRPRGNLFLFCDIKRWNELRSMASRLGWDVFPRPIIWQKSETEGLAPWGRQGFRVTYDAILYATKGSRGLITSPTDILSVKRVGRHVRTHAAEKPVELLKLLIECSTLVGDNVLDPCCGSGSTLIAARECNRKALGIELDEDHFNTAMANVFGGENNEEGIQDEPTAATGN